MTESSEPQVPEPNGSDLLYDVARWQLDEQAAHRTALNARLATFFATATAVLVLFGALIRWTPESSGLPNAAIGLLIAAIAVYILMIAVSLRAYRDRGWSIRPNLVRLRDLERQVDLETLQRWIAEQISVSVIRNDAHLRNKSSLVWLAVLLWAVEVVLLASAAVVAALA